MFAVIEKTLSSCQTQPTLPFKREGVPEGGEDMNL